MTNDELQFFHAKPDALPLYEALRGALLDLCPDTQIRVHATQITFQARHGFAFVSLRRLKGCPPVFLLLTIGLARRLDSPRVAVAVEPYPNRWTHHLVISNPAQLDGELLGWLREAHDFALLK